MYMFGATSFVCWCYEVGFVFFLVKLNHHFRLHRITRSLFSGIIYTSVPSFICQNVISQTMRFPIRRSPSVFMNVAMWEHCTRDRFSDAAKFTTLIPFFFFPWLHSPA